MRWETIFHLLLSLMVSGCAVSVQQLPPPDQPEPTVTRTTEVIPEAGVDLSAGPGDTLLRVKSFDISQQTINTHMWQPAADFAIDAPLWPEYSATTKKMYVAQGTAEWHGENYIVLDDEDGNISWGPAKNAHLLLNMDGTFDGVMGVETGTFKAKIVRGPDPVTFTRYQIDKTEIIYDESYTNFQIVLVSLDDDKIIVARREYVHNSDGLETLDSERIVSLDKDLRRYTAESWQIDFQPSDGLDVIYSVSPTLP